MCSHCLGTSLPRQVSKGHQNSGARSVVMQTLLSSSGKPALQIKWLGFAQELLSVGKGGLRAAVPHSSCLGSILVWLGRSSSASGMWDGMGRAPPLSSYHAHLQHPAFHAGQYLHFDWHFPGGCEVDGDAELNA